MRRALLAAAALAGAVSAASPATAATSPTELTTGTALTAATAPAAEAVTSRDANTTSDPGAASRTASYWTAERMRQAKPAPRPKAGPPTMTPVRRGAAGSVPAAAPAPGQSAPADLEPSMGIQAVNASKTVGKVFFTDPTNGGNYVCSASSLNSVSKRLVLTAGHCVHGGTGGTWMTNWIFVPKYYEGVRPFGTFPAKTLHAFRGWTNSSDLNYDVGMVVTHPNSSGTRVVDAVGGNGLTYNGSRTWFATVLGYPAGAPFDGQRQYACQDTTASANSTGSKISVDCGFTGGASGSPWLYSYDGNTQLGQARGIMSTHNPSTGENRSPYFGDAVKSLYDSVDHLS